MPDIASIHPGWESAVVFCSQEPRVMSHAEAVSMLRDNNVILEKDLEEMLTSLEEEADEWTADDCFPADWLNPRPRP